MNAEKMISY